MARGWLEAVSKWLEGVTRGVEGTSKELEGVSKVSRVSRRSRGCLEGDSKGKQPTAEREPAPEPAQVGARATSRGNEGARRTGFEAWSSSSIGGVEGKTYLEARLASESDLGEGLDSREQERGKGTFERL